MNHLFSKLPVRQTACNDIIDEFTRMIRKGHLKVNDRLPSERDLAEKFGVGRSTVREALKSMTIMGLLEAKQGEGTFVRKINSDSIKQQVQWSFFLNPSPIHELIELRELIELKTIENAVSNRSEEHLRKMKESIDAMENSIHNAEENKKHDYTFHMTIAEASENKLMFNLLELTRLQLEEWFSFVLQIPDFAKKTIDEHRAIHEAIRNRDANTAKDLMKRHLDHGAIRLHEALLNKKFVD